jgi:microcystin-dependent protein
MSEPYLGEIRMGGFNFAPRGWAFCNGQILPIAQNTALFSLLGTTYGGDGQTTFALPDLRGRVPMHWGSGPGLTPRVIGEASGSETVTLITTQIPQHTHLMNTTASVGGQLSPNGNFLGAQARGGSSVYSATADGTTLSASAIGVAGGSQPHDNLQPYLAVTFIIALNGIFPSRN